jgi:hypothetical protein
LLSLQVQNSFRGLRPCSRDSASSFPSCEAFLTTRQDSLYVTAWDVARPVSDRYFGRYASTHRFLHTQVSQLHGGLAPPVTGFSPARRCVPLGTPNKKAPSFLKPGANSCQNRVFSVLALLSCPPVLSFTSSHYTGPGWTD